MIGVYGVNNDESLKISIRKHIEYVSLNRLRPYISLCRKYDKTEVSCGNYEAFVKGLGLYSSLQGRSNLFFSLLQELEVSVRNTMSNLLKQHLAPNRDLVSYFCYLAFNVRSELSPISKAQLQKNLWKFANQSNLKSENLYYQLKLNQITEGDIIASLSLGFWIHFFNPRKHINPHFEYWSKFFCQHNIFNKNFASIPAIFDALSTVLLCRNRLYHQEKIWGGKNIRTPRQALFKLKRRYDFFLALLSKIAPERYIVMEQILLQRTIYRLSFNEELFNEEWKQQTEHIGLAEYKFTVPIQKIVPG